MTTYTDRQKACIEVAVALEQQRALKIVEAVRKQGFSKSASEIPTQAESAFDLACEEIEHRLRTEVWELDGVAAPLESTSSVAGFSEAKISDEHCRTLTELLTCFMSWEPQVRVLGNVRADDAANAIRTVLAAPFQPAAAPGEPVALSDEMIAQAAAPADRAADETN